jgi:hypothetical protein
MKATGFPSLETFKKNWQRAKQTQPEQKTEGEG